MERGVPVLPVAQTVKAAAVAMVVAPLSVTAPAPVEKVFAPDWAKAV